MTPLETVRAYYDLFGQRSREALDQVVTPDFVADDDPINLHVRGVADLWRAIDRTPPGPTPTGEQGSFVVEEYIGDGARGAARWHWRAPGSTAALFGLPVSGNMAEIDGLALVEFKDGKLSRLTEFWDSAGAMRQFGAEIPSPRWR